MKVKVLKVPLKEAEKIKKKLVESKTINNDYIPERDKDFIYFPLNAGFASKHEVIEESLKKKKEKTSFKKEIEKVVPQELHKHIKTSYDTLADIAIIEISEELEKHKTKIGQALLKSNNKIKTVLQRGKHEGTFRLQKLEHIAGKRNKEVTITENGVKITLNPEEVYYSTRLSTERLRIARHVKQDEEILVMFSGCSPYECTLAKNSPAKDIVGVEINPQGHQYSNTNIKQNKIKNVKTYCGNVNIVVPQLDKKFDRIIMPLPKDAPLFTDLALLALKKEGGIINMYVFGTESEVKQQQEFVKTIIQESKRKAKFSKPVKCGSQGPGSYRWCLDIKVE